MMDGRKVRRVMLAGQIIHYRCMPVCLPSYSIDQPSQDYHSVTTNGASHHLLKKSSTLMDVSPSQGSSIWFSFSAEAQNCISCFELLVYLLVSYLLLGMLWIQLAAAERENTFALIMNILFLQHYHDKHKRDVSLEMCGLTDVWLDSCCWKTAVCFHSLMWVYIGWCTQLASVHGHVTKRKVSNTLRYCPVPSRI